MSQQATQATTAENFEARSPEVDEVLAHVDRHLEAGNPKKALEALNRAKVRSPWIANATAVCQIRAENAGAAVEILRGLVVKGSIYLRDDIPPVFKVNFAAALLASGNFDGFLGTLGEIGDDEHPSARRYRESLRRWKEGQTLWERAKLALGGRPARPFEPGFPLGDLT